MLKKLLKRLFQEIDLKSFLLLIAGSLAWSLTMVKSGMTYPFGIGFWGANGHDGIWHIALTRSIVRDLAAGTLWSMPVYAGEGLKNYHLGFDQILSFFHIITKIPVSTLYFQIFPPILSFMAGFSCWLFVYLWTKSKSQAFWSTFFVYFGGSFGWIVTLIREGKFAGESMFWSQQSISTLINPPFALSIIILFVGLIALLKAFDSQSKQKLYSFLAVGFLGCLIGIKVYAGLLVTASLFASGVYLYIRRKDLKLLKIFAGVFLLSFLLFFPAIGASGSLIVFKPFWFLETMLGISDRFYWPKMYEAIMNYKLGGIWYKLIPAYVIALVIFTVGNLGTRFVSIKYFFEKFKSLKSINWVDIFVVTIVLAGIVVPLLFLQSGTPWNTIQFFYYSLLFLGILSGISMGKFLEDKKPKLVYLYSFLIIVLTLPTTIATLANDYIPSRPPAKIANQEIEALKFLEKQETGVVLTYLFDDYKAKEAENDPPRSLYNYTSTAYVSAYSNKPVYLEDEVNLDITGYDWRVRRAKVEEFLQMTNAEEAKDFLKENNIKYLYFVKDVRPFPGETLKVGESQLEIKRIFDNSGVEIFIVN